MEILDRVNTPHGAGTLTVIDDTCARCRRYGVELDKNVFGWNENCYYFFAKEVSPLKNMEGLTENPTTNKAQNGEDI